MLICGFHFCFFDLAAMMGITYLEFRGIQFDANKCTLRRIRLLEMEFWQYCVSIIYDLAISRRVVWTVMDVVEHGESILQYWVVSLSGWVPASLDWFLVLDFICVLAFCKVDCWSYWCARNSLCKRVIPAPGWLPWALSNGSTTGEEWGQSLNIHHNTIYMCSVVDWSFGGLTCLGRLFFFILPHCILIFTAMAISV